ncbi:UNVERIFIED_CONTAM: Retrovirus-related Pol polyprotein from transposon RE2 [Sesamum latifolium]|uniref:Retrovirus-related Pol polyprotein from transposon RE2 n=1 Tax=Sesamum latifolium TaxID=2727402 RepID=A0AAW2U1W4_9LAMI
MNGLEKSINELINMLVQYEATTNNSEPSVLVGEASTYKAKGKGARSWKRKKGKAKTAASALSAPVSPVGMGKGKGRWVPSQSGQMISVCIAEKRAIGRGSAPSSSPVQVLERSKKLSRDEVVLKLGNGKVVAAEAVGIVHLVVSDQTPYQIWHGKPASYKYLRVWGSPAYVKRLVGDKLDSSLVCAVFLEKSFPADTRREELLLEESSEATPQTDTVTSSVPTVPTNDIPVLRRSTRVPQQPEREVTTFKARLVAKGYTQRPGVDFEKTYSPVAMAKSIRIMLAIVAWYDYEIWQMDVKAAFLNGFVEKEIYMDQPEGFTSVGEEQKVCYLQRSIYGQWELSCVPRALCGRHLAHWEYVKMLGDTKAWLSTQFTMKDLGEASYILDIKIIQDRSKRMLGMTQTSYVEKVLKRSKMKNSKRGFLPGFLPVRHGVKLCKK